MTKTEIKKLEDFVSGYIPQSIESAEEILLNDNSVDFSALVKSFEDYLNNGIPRIPNQPLTPQQITAFSRWMILNSEFENRFGYTSCHFLTPLLQSSYDRGYNNFILDLRDSVELIQEVARDLIGTNERPIRIEVLTDNSAISGGSDSTWLELKINGSVNYVGNRSENSLFVIEGDLKQMGAALNCTFVINGNLLEELCLSKRSAKHCTIRTPRLRNLLYISPDLGSNKLIYIRPDGTEEEVK